MGRWAVAIVLVGLASASQEPPPRRLTFMRDVPGSFRVCVQHRIRPDQFHCTTLSDLRRYITSLKAAD
ncbi:MAG: hypothetical protein Q8Q14_05980 [Gemmatimonadales bacterium]|nr:hypothetical protein [Gemmatimonadales bacterium]